MVHTAWPTDNTGQALIKSPSRLAVLLPITSRRVSSAEAAGATHRVLACLQQLAGSLTPSADSTSTSSASASTSPVCVLLGIDSDDAALLEHQQGMLQLCAAAGVPAQVQVFGECDRSEGPGAVCRLWGLMAKEAVQQGCNLAVLLGDDTLVAPAGWPRLVLSAFDQDPRLMLLLLNDVADPGFPSFPVLRVDRHLEVFGELLPACFVNQGGDPYLAALYRSWQGAVRMLPDVSVRNLIGGVQRCDKAYTPPRYSRCTVSKEVMLQELLKGTRCLEAAAAAAAAAVAGGGAASACSIALTDSAGKVPASLPSSQPTPDLSPSGDAASSGASASDECAVDCVLDLPAGGDGGACGERRQLAVDVLVPTARVDMSLLQGIADAVLAHPPPPGCSLSLVLVVDKPRASLTAAQAVWLQQLQDRWLHRVRVRFNDTNLGTSATRNRALQESLAEYVVLWDDDIKPSPDCLAAYVAAFKAHPEAKGFAGPSYIPKDPASLWHCAVHQADVLFFWSAAEDWHVAEVMPWAVTANVALANTPALFDMRFPKTGGGEDIDDCLKVTGGRLVPVPQASVHHPLWNNGRRCYNRFFGWAFGDGALIPMYPQLCYWAAPCSAESCYALLLGGGAAAALSALLAAASVAAQQTGSMLAGVDLGSRVVGAAATGGGWGSGVARTAGTAEAVSGWAVSVSGVGVALAAAAAAFKLADLVLDVGRAFERERVLKHPCTSWWLRAGAAAEASLIKTWSEAGRLWGHVVRGELLQGTLCRRFELCGGASGDGNVLLCVKPATPG